MGYFRLWPCPVFPSAVPWLVTFLSWFIKNTDKSPNTSLLRFFFSFQTSSTVAKVTKLHLIPTAGGKRNSGCVHRNIYIKKTKGKSLIIQQPPTSATKFT